MTTAMISKDLSIPFEATLDILKAEEDEKGRWILEGFASTTDQDLQNELVTQEAIDSSANDLEENSTVLLNHDQKIPIGRVLESEARKGGLWIKVLISKTVPDTWTKIKEGVLNKFSIRGKVIDAVKEWSEKLGKFIKVIKKMFLVEASLVSVPANPNAKALRWYIEKAFDLWESEGGKLQTIDKTGGQVMDGKVRTEKDGVPEIVKDDDIKKDVSEMDGEELVKAATAHAALVKEKMDAVTKVAESIANGAGNMDAEALRAKLSQLSELGWSIGDEAKVVNVLGDGGAAKSDDGTDSTVKSEDGNAEVKKGFPAPDALLSEWGEFCKTNELDSELDDTKVFEKWVEFCKEKGYPEPYAYPYAETEKADGEKVKEVIALVDKLMDGADDAAKAVLGQIKSLLNRMVGGASPYPTPSPTKADKKPEEEEEKPMHKDGGDGDDKDIEKKGAKMKTSRLQTLKTIIEKLQGLAEDLTPELAKQLETMTKNLADETKAEESLEELKKTLAVEARQTLSDLMDPIEKRLERIESIEGIQKSEKGQEKTPDEKPDKKKTGGKDEDVDKKPSVWGGILGNSLERAKAGFQPQ